MAHSTMKYVQLQLLVLLSLLAAFASAGRHYALSSDFIDSINRKATTWKVTHTT